MRNLDKIVIFDLDGTLANISHRLPLLEYNKWDEFYKKCTEDKPINNVIKINQALYRFYKIYIFTGRSETVKEETIYWLNKNKVLFDRIFMREIENYIPGNDLKEKWLKEIGGEVLFAYDDDPKSIEMYKRNGIKCCQFVTPKDQINE